MYKVFDTLQEYNQFTNDGANLTAGVIYYVNEDGSTHFQTNNIDGEEKVYDMIDGIPEGYIVPSGNISITENGENINVNEYATASVNVPIPEGYIVPSGNKEITQNGTNIDIAQYATASVNVAPNLTTQNITENGTYQPSGNYDGFSSVTVNVAGSGGNEDLIDLIERDITTFNIPSGTTKIGDYIFYKCTGLTSVTIPNSVTEIGNYVFQGCNGLTSVTIPNSVTAIGGYAFDLCTGLTSVTIPNSVTEIDGYAFRNCSGLTKVEISDIAAWCKIIFGSDVANPLYYAHHLYLNGKEVTNLVIPNSITKINGYAFRNCSGLTSVTIPNSVTEINGYAFRDCSGLTSVTIPNSVRSIGNDAFRDCSGLTSITIQATTPPSLGSSAFDNTNNCPIYVPSESVDAYKTATNWSSYASRIQAIPTE